MGLGDDFGEIIAYFRGRRQPGKLNLKSDVSPKALKDYLPWIALLEPIWDEGGRVVNARVTLHGSAAAAAYTDVTGKLVRDVHKPEVANRLVASLDTANSRRAGVIGVSEERHGPPPHVRLNILYLPVTSDGEQITHFFAYGRLDRLEDHE
ncbi:hypothetical protein [Kordiimonas sp.]|uniref:hypothetical protein n=1 Tax=Kordiimonas sp. TaxID=1970157 RepID=UPI003A8FFD5B